MPALMVFALAIGCGAGGSNGQPDGRSAPGPGGQVPGPGGQDRSGTAPRGPLPPPGIAWVIFGADTVKAEVANTSELRSRGLMYRDQLPPGTGMLFVFEDAQPRSFWMQNTYVALDIAFMDAQMQVVDIQQMEPRTEDFHESRAPAMFALEVPKGWFAAHRIGIGARAQVVFGG
jgi:uncharacterized membrane protein (UPF0127 family)